MQMSPSAMDAVFCVSCRPGAGSNSLRQLVQADRQQGLCKDRAGTLPAHSGTEVVVVGCAGGEASLGGYALTMQSAWWSSR